MGACARAGVSSAAVGSATPAAAGLGSARKLLRPVIEKKGCQKRAGFSRTSLVLRRRCFLPCVGRCEPRAPALPLLTGPTATLTPRARLDAASNSQKFTVNCC